MSCAGDGPGTRKAGAFTAASLTVGSLRLTLQLQHCLVSVLAHNRKPLIRATLASQQRQGCPLKQWTHLAVTCSDANGVRLYVNSELLGSAPCPRAAAASEVGDAADSFLALGRTNTAAGRTGSVALARLWRAERTQSEVKDAMRSALPPQTSSLLAQWQLNEGFGAWRWA